MSLPVNKEGRRECLEFYEDCDLCPLHSTRNKIVWGEYYIPNPKVMLVGEGPGYHEDKTGRPFVEFAKSGEEMTHQLHTVARISREDCYVCNLVKCRVPNDKDPKPIHIEACKPFLDAEVEMVNPAVIGTVGGFATRYFLGDVSMERVNAIPYVVGSRTVVPIYHPAAGLRDHSKLLLTQAGFRVLGRVYRGEQLPIHIEDAYPSPIYRELTDADV